MNATAHAGTKPDPAGLPAVSGVPRMHHSSSDRSGELSQALGWFSIALGVSELLAPGKLRRSVGMSRRAGALIPLYGLREIVTGLGLLGASNASPWLWARFAGDILDVATLSPELRRDNSKRLAACIGMAFLAAAALVDFFAARRLGEAERSNDPMAALTRRN
jgi:hypothetical protein